MQIPGYGDFAFTIENKYDLNQVCQVRAKRITCAPKFLTNYVFDITSITSEQLEFPSDDGAHVRYSLFFHDTSATEKSERPKEICRGN